MTEAPIKLQPGHIIPIRFNSALSQLSGVQPPVRRSAMHSSSRKWDCRRGERPIIEIIPYV
jgi:hypothetical protein